MTTPIFLLHGLGEHPITLLPLEIALSLAGYSNIYRLSYPADTLPFETCLDNVYHQIINMLKTPTDPVVLIGQSMGGVISNNLHAKGLNIQYAIYIGSPLHGANLINQLESVLPQPVVHYFNKIPYDFLKSKTADPEPPHPYHTISMGWAWSTFDGCVYQEETMLDEKHHTHISWMDHRTGFANPRLWLMVVKLLNNNLSPGLVACSKT